MFDISPLSKQARKAPPDKSITPPTASTMLKSDDPSALTPLNGTDPHALQSPPALPPDIVYSKVSQLKTFFSIY